MRRTGWRRPWRRLKPDPLPGVCASRLSVSAVVFTRPSSSRAAASPIRSGSRLGGRPAQSRQCDKRFAAGPSGSPTAKRRSRSAPSSALRRSILAEAVALFSARRTRSAPAAGGSVRRMTVEQRKGGAGREQGIALPCPPARPRPGRDRRWRKGLPFRGFCRARLGSRPRRGRRVDAFRTVWRQVGEQVEIGANHSAMVSPWRRFVTFI